MHNDDHRKLVCFLTKIHTSKMGSTNAVQQALLAGLSKSVFYYFQSIESPINFLCRLKTSADYFDLTITCGGKEFKVHRAVVCSQSDFFDAACKGSFKVRTAIT